MTPVVGAQKTVSRIYIVFEDVKMHYMQLLRKTSALDMMLTKNRLSTTRCC